MRRRLVVTLAHEIGGTHSSVGKARLERCGRKWNREDKREQGGNGTTPVSAIAARLLIGRRLRVVSFALNSSTENPSGSTHA